MKDNFSEYESLHITLTPEQAVNPLLLTPPSERYFGPTPEIEDENIEIRIGRRPIARSLRAMYELAGRKLPPGLDVFKSYKLWLLTHVASIIKEPGKRDLRRLGYEVDFPSEPRVTVVEVFPQSRFVNKGGIITNNKFVFDAGVNLNGQVSPPESLTALLDKFETFSFGGKAQGNLKLSTQTEVVGRLSFVVMTPVIEAIGVGDDFSKWVFSKDTQPLVGDHLMMQVLLVPKTVSELRFKARVSATLTTFFGLPYKLESRWVKLTCPLPREVA